MKLAIIFSNWTLEKIFNFLKDYLNAKDGEIALGNVERQKIGKEMKDTNRTLILMKESLFDRAMEEKLNMKQPNLDFLIADFIMGAKYFPLKSQSSDFYIKIPDLPLSDIEILIQEKMSVFIRYGLINNGDYKLIIPLKSRITGQHRNFAIIKFQDNVDISTRSYIKALINNSLLYFNGKVLHYLPVFWTKNHLLSNK